RLGPRTMRADLLAQQVPVGRGDRESPAAEQQPIEMVVEPADAAVAACHRLEHAVAVGESSIARIDPARPAVDERYLLHAANLSKRALTPRPRAPGRRGSSQALERERPVRAAEPEGIRD